MEERPTELWNETDRLRAQFEKLQQKNKKTERELRRLKGEETTEEGNATDEELHYPQTEPKKKRSNKRLVCVLVIVLLILVSLLMFSVGLIVAEKRQLLPDSSTLVESVIKPIASASQAGQSINNVAGLLNKPYINIAQRTDFLLQDCGGTHMKRSFPDLDYALKGYNILRGFPLSLGHDPGFTLPIFSADYDKPSQTADCRFSVPQGLSITPDISCVVSFSSKVIQTRFEFSKSLSVSAEVSGGGWGVSFSASAGYKQASSSISTGEFSYILSTASCRYYYSEVLPNDPPPFHPSFIDAVKTLNRQANSTEAYIHFFDTYGTHFAPSMIFGARYTHENKISSKKLETMSEKGVNVGVAASYSGLFSVGGSFSMDSNQRQSASDFQKEVETKTITVGAPPPKSGEAQAWASSVKENPVPVEYKLESLEDIFTEDYMRGLDVDYKYLQTKIRQHKMDYCAHLQEKGEVDTCAELAVGLELRNTRLYKHYRSFEADRSTCIEECMSEIPCVAITQYHGTQNSWDKKHCWLYKEKNEQELQVDPSSSEESADWKVTIFIPKIFRNFTLVDTSIEGVARQVKDLGKAPSESHCWARCYKDEQCVAYSFCTCPEKQQNCRLYAERSITGMKKSVGMKSRFISKLELPDAIRNAITTTTTTSTTPVTTGINN